jgi:predicted transcriptional regulator
MFRPDERMEWSFANMLANRRRSTSEVLKEILLSSPATKSNIRYSVGLNLRQAKRYLPHLIDEGYLRLAEDERGSAIYEISDKGKKLLQILSDLSEMTELTDELPHRDRVPGEPVVSGVYES